ncbi:WD40 repeat-containing protein [Nitzschia inconspicua]|uniref:WD40 repeat-containing protein n=1 Tax=Nitzschia inconspicua TaxID=303405 RepID=A0A9K3LB50_9STRA|nr:WD40 repeat-containing protein [Nitzschia inconspicua]
MSPFPISVDDQKQRQSILRNLFCREYGFRRPDDFSHNVARFFDTKQLLQDPEVVSPHRKAVSCLAMESNTGRFLLAGSIDGTVSIYDISKWGRSDGSKRNGGRPRSSSVACYPPIARSLMVPAEPNILRLPSGHSSSVTFAQWYPTDAGVFVSGSSDGTVLLWDTARMKPVLRAHPFGKDGDVDYRAASWIAGHLRTTTGGSTDYNNNNLMVAGSYSHTQLKLVDIRSGASSHQLVGHQGGISCVQWSPTNAHVVASGSRDGCIRLWDVRKSGSRSCITFLDRNKVPYGATIQPGGYSSDYAHLRTDQFRSRYVYSDKKKVTKKRQREEVAPNSYDHLESQGANQSHYGKVGALKFLENGQYIVSVGGDDGELILWDLRNGCSLPNKFVGNKYRQAGAPKQKRVALLTSRLGRSSRREDTTAIWIASHGEVLGYSTEGGKPKQVLRGHLTNVTSLENMEPGRRILSGGADGMILCWGQPQSALVMGRPVVLAEDKDSW